MIEVVHVEFRDRSAFPNTEWLLIPGLGAVPMENGHPVAYASKSLTETEQRYAQVEKEMLAIVFAALHFDQYLYGKDVIVGTDHKPLESIFKKPLLKCPKR